MTFEETLKCMREGKKVKVARLSPNYIYLKNDYFYCHDGLYSIPCGFFENGFYFSRRLGGS